MDLENPMVMDRPRGVGRPKVARVRVVVSLDAVIEIPGVTSDEEVSAVVDHYADSVIALSGAPTVEEWEILGVEEDVDYGDW